MSNINWLCMIDNIVPMVHNNYYLHRLAGVCRQATQALSVEIDSLTQRCFRGTTIASLKDYTDSQARSSNRPTVGGNGRNRNTAQINTGNDTYRPVVVADLRVSPRSGMAESCL
jgi:hypothetical protein